MRNRMLGLISSKYLTVPYFLIEDIEYCVYFITDGYAVKIGMASTLPNRIKQLQIGNPRKIRALFVIKADNQVEALRIEGDLHKTFNNKHLLGEWFDITDEDIKRGCKDLGYEIGKPISKFNFDIEGIDIA